MGMTGQSAARAGWQILIAVIFTTITTLAALALTFIVYLRPLLKVPALLHIWLLGTLGLDCLP